MRMVEKAAVALGVVAVAVCCSAPAGADPGTDPCQSATTFLCKFMLIAPDLDHDIDLTQGPATINGTPVPQLPAPARITQAPPPGT